MSTFLSEVIGERWRKEMEIYVTDVISCSVSMVIMMMFCIIFRDDCLFVIV